MSWHLRHASVGLPGGSPFPPSRRYILDPSEIRFASYRHFVNYDKREGIENFFTTGAETMSGTQVDLLGPYEFREDAVQNAYPIVYQTNSQPRARSRYAKATTVAGAAWERAGGE